MTGKQANMPRHVALFVTCLVDLYRPTVGFAAIKLLEDAGCVVDAPRAQTCCGQPAYNSGDRASAAAIAIQVIETFEGYDAVVAPSGSCAGMIHAHYEGLFADDPAMLRRAKALAAKTFELTAFLVDVLGVTKVAAAFPGPVTYHDSCSGLRELKVRDQPRRLLDSVAGLSVIALPDAEVCCGFGGTFCVKYSEISDKMVSAKALAIENTGAETLLAGDLGCLLNMAGKLTRRGSTIGCRHVAEVLAGMTDAAPPIGHRAGGEPARAPRRLAAS